MRAGRDEIVDRTLAPAMDDEGITLLENVLRHGPAHETEPDESDGF